MRLGDLLNIEKNDNKDKVSKYNSLLRVTIDTEGVIEDAFLLIKNKNEKRSLTEIAEEFINFGFEKECKLFLISNLKLEEV